MSKDVRDMTILEFINAPGTWDNFYSRKYNKPLTYCYYDTPDGQDIDKKLYVANRYALGTALAVALFDNRLFTNPVGLGASLNRAAYIVLPFTGIVNTYVALSYAATNLRGKDDALNCAFAGVVSGSLVGTWFKSNRIGIFSALILGLYGAIRNHTQRMGINMFDWQNCIQINGDHKTPFYDTTITPIGERGWTTGR